MSSRYLKHKYTFHLGGGSGKFAGAGAGEKIRQEKKKNHEKEFER